MAVSIDDKLGLLRFNVDHHESHIEINKQFSDQREMDRLIMACPAKLYDRADDGSLTFNYEGCLECGTCRVLSGGKGITSWKHPQGGMGVTFRKG